MRKVKSVRMYEKTEKLVSSVYDFSQDIPAGDLYALGDRIRYSIRGLSGDVAAFYSKFRIDRIKAGIKAQSKISECEDYLKMAKSLRYADTDNIVGELKELKKWLKLEAKKAKEREINHINSIILTKSA